MATIRWLPVSEVKCLKSLELRFCFPLSLSLSLSLSLCVLIIGLFWKKFIAGYLSKGIFMGHLYTICCLIFWQLLPVVGHPLGLCCHKCLSKENKRWKGNFFLVVIRISFSNLHRLSRVAFLPPPRSGSKETLRRLEQHRGVRSQERLIINAPLTMNILALFTFCKEYFTRDVKYPSSVPREGYLTARVKYSVYSTRYFAEVIISFGADFLLLEDILLRW